MVWQMRPALLLLAVAITIAACGGKAHPSADADADDGADGVFVNQAGFQPTSFTVDVQGKGRPVIFIPGLGCPRAMWKDVIAKLGDGVQAHVLTLPGFAG